MEAQEAPKIDEILIKQLKDKISNPATDVKIKEVLRGKLKKLENNQTINK